MRGSIAATGAEFSGIGGNTSCLEVRVADAVIILDAGTGLARLGQTWAPRTAATFFFSHLHWDHIQGFPFFRPAYVPGNRFTLYGPGDDGAAGLHASLDRQMQPPNFPVTLSAMAARLDFRSIRAGDEVCVDAARIRAAALNHPQGCLGYRISVGSSTLVYATDTEEVTPGAVNPAVLELARNADLLIHDAQYTEDEYYGSTGPARRGWGHSTITAACRLARAAGVKQLALFHHDPSHDDRLLERLRLEARIIFANVVVAREGMVVQLIESEAPESPDFAERPVSRTRRAQP